MMKMVFALEIEASKGTSFDVWELISIWGTRADAQDAVDDLATAFRRAGALAAAPKIRIRRMDVQAPSLFFAGPKPQGICNCYMGSELGYCVLPEHDVHTRCRNKAGQEGII